MRTAKWAALTLTLVAWVAVSGAAETAPTKPKEKIPYVPTTADDACGPKERWRFSSAVPADWQNTFPQLLKKKIPAVTGFAEAMALRRRAHTPEVRAVSEYFLSRSVYETKLVHIAVAGFASIAAREPETGLYGVQVAALECLSRIHDANPAIRFPHAVTARLPELFAFPAADESQREVLRTYAGIAIRDELAKGDVDEAELESIAKLLKGAPAHETLARGLIAAQQRKQATVTTELEKFLAIQFPPATLKKYHDDVRILISRAYYAQGKYDAAAKHLRLVHKNSNELAQSLSELAWAHLQDDRHADAIGTAISLGTGGMRHTFAPEAPMVMAMALNELCQFPESLKAIHSFRRDYDSSYNWLDKWSKGKRDPAKLYGLAVKFLRYQAEVREKGRNPANDPGIPVRVGTEWIRSPVFISHQEEINLLFDEQDGKGQIGRSGAREQKILGQEIVKHSKELKLKIKAARAKLTPGQRLPQALRDDVHVLKLQLARYKRLRAAAGPWKNILASSKRQAKGIEKRLMAEIAADLENRTVRMQRQLEEVAENNQLIEVEILNGASQDIIWQNAHPEYRKVASAIDDAEKEKQGESRSQVWNWGSTAGYDGENGEVWEDELGSFKADLFDNCASKDKYLAIRRGNS